MVDFTSQQLFIVVVYSLSCIPFFILFCHFFVFFWSIFIIFISRRFDPFGMYSKWLWQLDTLDDATAALPPGSCGNMTQGEIPGVLL